VLLLLLKCANAAWQRGPCSRTKIGGDASSRRPEPALLLLCSLRARVLWLLLMLLMHEGLDKRGKAPGSMLQQGVCLRRSRAAAASRRQQRQPGEQHWRRQHEGWL
jgi:hypothetical protein